MSFSAKQSDVWKGVLANQGLRDFAASLLGTAAGDLTVEAEDWQGGEILFLKDGENFAAFRFEFVLENNGRYRLENVVRTQQGHTMLIPQSLVEAYVESFPSVRPLL